MKLLLKHFLIVNFTILSGCASEPVSTKFDGDWTFITPAPTSQVPNPAPKACISESSVMELRKILLKCEAKK